MRSKPKIIVLHMKEIIYTAIFVALGILLLFLLISMFRPKEEPTRKIEEAYYTSSILL